MLLDKNNKVVYKNKIAQNFEENDFFILKEISKDDFKIVIFSPYEDYIKVCDKSITGLILLKEGKIIYANKVAEEIICNKDFYEMVHPDDIEKFMEWNRKKSIIIRLIGCGKTRWVKLMASKVKNTKATLLNMVDVTDMIEAKEKLMKEKKKMQKVLEKERKFLEEISHYFFNPLCIAKGYLDLSIPNADPSMRRRLEITKEAVTRVENVVKHIVTEGKIYE